MLRDGKAEIPYPGNTYPITSLVWALRKAERGSQNSAAQSNRKQAAH